MPTSTTITSNSTIWTTWCHSTATSSVTDVWYDWCEGTTTSVGTCSTGTCSTGIWVTWCSDGTGSTLRTNNAVAPERMTAEQIAEREALRQVELERRSEMQRKLQAAEKKAEQLLLENLSLKQQLEFKQHGHFTVHGPAGRRWRIRKGRSGNVDVIDKDGRIADRLCAHPVDRVPDFDTMLAQRLMLETDPDMFERIANTHGRPLGSDAPVMEALH